MRADGVQTSAQTQHPAHAREGRGGSRQQKAQLEGWAREGRATDYQA